MLSLNLEVSLPENMEMKLSLGELDVVDLGLNRGLSQYKLSYNHGPG